MKSEHAKCFDLQIALQCRLESWRICNAICGNILDSERSGQPFWQLRRRINHSASNKGWRDKWIPRSLLRHSEYGRPKTFEKYFFVRLIDDFPFSRIGCWMNFPTLSTGFQYSNTISRVLCNFQKFTNVAPACHSSHDGQSASSDSAILSR